MYSTARYALVRPLARQAAGEPVDDRAAGDQSEEKGRIQDRQFLQICGQAVGERHDDGKDHSRRADHGSADEHGLGGGFKSVAGVVVLFKVLFGARRSSVETELAPGSPWLIPGMRLDPGRVQTPGLRVIRHRTVGIDRDRDGTHAEELECDQTEGEHGRRQHQVARPSACSPRVNGAHPEASSRSRTRNALKVSGDEAGQNGERCSRPPREDDTLHGRGATRWEVKALTSSGISAAGQEVLQVITRRQLPPKRGISAQFGDEEIRSDVGQNQRIRSRPSKPERRKRRFIIEASRWRSGLWRSSH